MCREGKQVRLNGQFQAHFGVGISLVIKGFLLELKTYN
jgi:hypothetical protein